MKLTDLYKLSDRDLLAELKLMRDGLSGIEASYNLAASDTAALTNAIDALETSVDTLDTKRAEVATQRGDRDNKRGDAIEAANSRMKTMRIAAGTDPAALGKVNLDEYDTTQSTADAPESVPFALIDFGILRHTINFHDSATPDKRSKPNGVLGCEIFSKVGGPAPTQDTDFTMIALDTATPYIVNYPMSDAGKTVWYRMRWVTKGGEKGGWSETVEATING